jgi:triacylglycerol lipase
MSSVPPAFHPSDARFNRANALYLAHASSIAYFRSPAVEAKEQLGLDAVAFFNPVTRTRGYLGVCDTHAVLAFRGTGPATFQNWATDAIVRLVAREEYAGRVHTGFSSALKHSWDRVTRVLEAVGDRPLFVTGHSLGGALALLASCRLWKLGRPAVATYTFGAPRVGDAAFCKSCMTPTYRVVNRLDLVPELPLASMRSLLPREPKPGARRFVENLGKLIDRVPCYGHVDTFVYLDRDGELTIGGNVEPWHAAAVARAIATRGGSFHEGITDHLITEYIRGLGRVP